MTATAETTTPTSAPSLQFSLKAAAVTTGTVVGAAAEDVFYDTTYDTRLHLAIGYFEAQHPGTTIRDGVIYFEGEDIGYFGIDK